MLVTAQKVTSRLNASFPVVCCNDAFILNNATRKVIHSHYFSGNDAQIV
ncbi:MAG: hypothetical protein LBJ12_02475 [Oscillospiraceae bacterium]|nr:hypothetical protein [Oscillospiraceae bacterium]